MFRSSASREGSAWILSLAVAGPKPISSCDRAPDSIAARVEPDEIPCNICNKNGHAMKFPYYVRPLGFNAGLVPRKLYMQPQLLPRTRTRASDSTRDLSARTKRKTRWPKDAVLLAIFVAVFLVFAGVVHALVPPEAAAAIANAYP